MTKFMFCSALPSVARVGLILAAAVLAGCGGGGGGSEPPPDKRIQATAPAASISVVPCTAAEGAKTCSTPVTISSANVLNTVLAVSGTNGDSFSVAVNATVTVTVTVPVGTTTYQTDFGGAAPAVASVTVVCDAGMSVDDSTGKCAKPPVAAAAAWPPKTMLSTQGVKLVLGTNQLPVGCISVSQQCWKDAVSGGTKVLFLDGNDGGKTFFAYFRNTSTAFGVTGLWNVLPLRANGSLYGSDIFGGGTQEVEWVMMNPTGPGAILHYSNGCTEVYPDLGGKAWTSRPTTCPAS